MYVHHERLVKAPKLLLEHSPGAYIETSLSTKECHVVVHFLESGEYEALVPRLETDEKKHACLVQTSLRVYEAAKEWEIDELCVLARGEFLEHADFVDLPCLMRMCDEVVSSFSGECEWFTEYFNMRVSKCTADASHTDSLRVLLEVDKPEPLSKTMLGSALRIASSANLSIKVNMSDLATENRDTPAISDSLAESRDSWTQKAGPSSQQAAPKAIADPPSEKIASMPDIEDFFRRGEYGLPPRVEWNPGTITPLNSKLSCPD